MMQEGNTFDKSFELAFGSAADQLFGTNETARSINSAFVILRKKPCVIAWLSSICFRQESVSLSYRPPTVLFVR